METKEQKQYYVTVGGQKVPVSEEVYRAYVRPVRARQRDEKRNKRCYVQGKRWKRVRCTEDCTTCPYAEQKMEITGAPLSLDLMAEQGAEINSIGDMEADLLAEEEREEQAKRLQAAIGCLTERQQYLIREIYFNGKTQKEIAEKMGISKQSVSDAVHRALTSLKKFLEKN